MLHHIDQERRLYVIHEGNGFSCIGFDSARKRTEALTAWLNRPAPNPDLWGTEEGYTAYKSFLDLGREHHAKTGQRCPAELTPELVGLERKRVEVVDCWGEKRRFWVGKSTGWMPCHLEIATIRSSGGTAVMGAPFKSVMVVRTR